MSGLEGSLDISGNTIVSGAIDPSARGCGLTVGVHEFPRLRNWLKRFFGADEMEAGDTQLATPRSDSDHDGLGI